MTTALQVRNVRISLGAQDVLKGIDLDIHAGRSVTILGPNGAGKSTLLKVLAGLLKAQGEVFLFGKSLSNLQPRLRAQQLSWLGQNEIASDDLSVWDVVMLGRLPHQNWLTGYSEADIQAVEMALKATHTLNWRKKLVKQ